MTDQKSTTHEQPLVSANSLREDFEKLFFRFPLEFEDLWNWIQENTLPRTELRDYIERSEVEKIRRTIIPSVFTDAGRGFGTLANISDTLDSLLSKKPKQ